MIKMDEKKFKLMQPCGKLFTHGREYWLLKPEPIPGDSWERDNTYRWIVVPNKVISHKQISEEDFMNEYPFARHIVTNSFTVEYSPNIPTIWVWQLKDIDLKDLELPTPNDGEPSPADTGYLHTQLNLQGMEV